MSLLPKLANDGERRGLPCCPIIGGEGVLSLCQGKSTLDIWKISSLRGWPSTGRNSPG